MKIRLDDIPSLRVTVMGLGLHGGGLASALFFTRLGARVTVTDFKKDTSVFQPFLGELEALHIRAVLGRHEERDFTDTDLVIKNPAVPPASPFLRLAREQGVPIETDLSIFLQLCGNPLIAVTGTKGKSTTASAIHHCLKASFPKTRLGGNITVSPLNFLQELQPGDPVVLELSSWQLADLKGLDLLRPLVSLVTVILPDHMDKYPDMASYVADKKVIFQSQSPRQFAVFNDDDPNQQGFTGETAAQVRTFARRPLPPGRPGAYLDGKIGFFRENGTAERLLGPDVAIPGEHNRLNLLAAALVCRLFGLEADRIAESLAAFPGIEHRLEFVLENRGVRFYNDSAATIPQATAAALRSLQPPLLLITGGTDKNLDFQPLAEAAGLAQKIFLLAGSATRKIVELFDRESMPYEGPFANLREALSLACQQARAGSSILFSPGCASFELFLNEFERGRKFKELVRSLSNS